MPTPEDEAAQKLADEAKAKADAAAAAAAAAANNQEKKFTQAELDAIIQDRLRRAEEKAAKEQREAKEKADREAAEKNGEWKTLAEAREKEAIENKAAAEEARAELRAERTKQAVIAAAGKPEFGDPKAPSSFAHPEAIYLIVKDEVADGAPESIAAALAKAAKTYPEYLVKVQRSPEPVKLPNSGQRPNITQQQTARPVSTTRY